MTSSSHKVENIIHNLALMLKNYNKFKIMKIFNTIWVISMIIKLQPIMSYSKKKPKAALVSQKPQNLHFYIVKLIFLYGKTWIFK